MVGVRRLAPIMLGGDVDRDIVVYPEEQQSLGDLAQTVTGKVVSCRFELRMHYEYDFSCNCSTEQVKFPISVLPV
jgi:hypothetical protein